MLLSTRAVGQHNNTAPHMIHGNLSCDVIINGVKLAVVTSRSYAVIDFFPFLPCTCCIINETKNALYGTLIFMYRDIFRMQIQYFTSTNRIRILFWSQELQDLLSGEDIGLRMTDYVISHRKHQQNNRRHVYSTFLKYIMDPNGTNIPKHTHNCAKHEMRLQRTEWYGQPRGVQDNEDRQCTLNVILWHVWATFVAVEKQ
jgi:hypothetical protein